MFCSINIIWWTIFIPAKFSLIQISHDLYKFQAIRLIAYGSFKGGREAEALFFFLKIPLQRGLTGGGGGGGGKNNNNKKKQRFAEWREITRQTVSVNEWLQGSSASLQLFTLHEHLLIQAKGKQAIFPLTYIINPSQKGAFFNKLDRKLFVLSFHLPFLTVWALKI